MDQKKIITAIRALVHDENVRLVAIEKELNMPQNALSGMLNGRRPFPKKWQIKLTEYLKARKTTKRR